MQIQQCLSAISLGLFVSIAAQAADDLELMTIMKEHNATGTMIIASENEPMTYIVNSERASTPLTPACTFNIVHAITAIETGILKDQNETYDWDGQIRRLDAWNKDQNLKSSFQISCVWFYQRVAEKVGKENYNTYLNKLDYGNHLFGDNLTTFWFETGSALQISPLDQIRFLQKIYHKQLPIADRTYAILQDVMTEKETPDYQIYSKSGAVVEDWVGHGWYVGYVVSKGKPWFFVTNIDINGIDDLPKRKDIAIAALKQKGII